MLGAMSATSLSNAMSCLFVSIEMSTIWLSMIMEITRLYSAFFVSPKSLSNISTFSDWKFADAISYMKWMYVGLCVNEYTGAKFYCDKKELNAAGKCPVTTGDQQMTNLGYNTYNADNCMAMLVCYIIVTRTIGYLSLRFIKT